MSKSNIFREFQLFCVHNEFFKDGNNWAKLWEEYQGQNRSFLKMSTDFTHLLWVRDNTDPVIVAATNHEAEEAKIEIILYLSGLLPKQAADRFKIHK